MNDIDAEIAALEVTPPAALRGKWADLTGSPIPKVSTSLLRLALAWEIQARALGGVPRKVSMSLEQMARGKTATIPARPGMRLAREWNGKVHLVSVGDDGVVTWGGREYRSLSEVARAITGTRWSGPAFFGLKKRRAA